MYLGKYRIDRKTYGKLRLTVNWTSAQRKAGSKKERKEKKEEKREASAASHLVLLPDGRTGTEAQRTDETRRNEMKRDERTHGPENSIRPAV